MTDPVATVVEADAALAADATPFHLPVGELAALVAGTVTALDDGDWWLPGVRERSGAVLRDVPLARLADGFQGAAPYRVAPLTPSPATRALHAVGLAMSDPEIAAVVHLGVGSTADGAWYEALNLAALQRARVVFVVAWRDLSGAPVPTQLAGSPLAVAAALGVRTLEVDGRAHQAVHDAVRAARGHDGPTLILASLDAD